MLNLASTNHPKKTVKLFFRSPSAVAFSIVVLGFSLWSGCDALGITSSDDDDDDGTIFNECPAVDDFGDGQMVWKENETILDEVADYPPEELVACMKLAISHQWEMGQFWDQAAGEKWEINLSGASPDTDISTRWVTALDGNISGGTLKMKLGCLAGSGSTGCQVTDIPFFEGQFTYRGTHSVQGAMALNPGIWRIVDGNGCDRCRIVFSGSEVWTTNQSHNGPTTKTGGIKGTI